MPADPVLLLGLVVFGAWVGVDGTSAGQFMVARPVVAATLAGWLAGDAATGALLGLVLEALSLSVLPVGAARYPEIGTAAVCAAVALVHAPDFGGALLTAVLFAVSWAWVGGVTVRYMRQANIRLVTAQVDGPLAVQRRHLSALAIDFLRAGAVVAVGVPLGAWVMARSADWWALEPGVSHVAVWSLVAAGVAAAFRLFGERHAGLFVGGAVCGLLALQVLR